MVGGDVVGYGVGSVVGSGVVGCGVGAVVSTVAVGDGVVTPVVGRDGADFDVGRAEGCDIVGDVVGDDEGGDGNDGIGVTT